MTDRNRRWNCGSRWLSSETAGPPEQSVAPDHDYYLPEQSHFVDRADVALNHAARVTATFLARWADRFEAYVLRSPPRPRQQGALPRDAEQRDEMIEGVLDWIERHSVEYLAVINLYRKDELILEQSDGIPGFLVHSRAEFLELQDAWERAGLPCTLYYRASQQRVVVEPVAMHGGTVRVSKRYSPLRWDARQMSSIGEAPPIPTEPERAVSFDRARKRFMSALRHRSAELSEPGCERGPAPDPALQGLLREVVLVVPWSSQDLPSNSHAEHATMSASVTTGGNGAIPSAQDQPDDSSEEAPAMDPYPRERPPDGAPPRGYHYYLPEWVYVRAGSGFAYVRAYQVTVRTVARWSDRFEAYLDLPHHVIEMSQDQERRREGVLPTSPEERVRTLGDIFTWFDRSNAPMGARIVNLYAGDETLLDQHDGVPGPLMLTAEQFTELQAAWAQADLPRDLYYLERNQRSVVEPIKYEGRVIRSYRRYTPLEWAQRDLQAIARMQVPAPAARAESFARACDRFAEAIRLRIAELSEPGQVLDPSALNGLERLLLRVELAALYARNPRHLLSSI